MTYREDRPTGGQGNARHEPQLDRLPPPAFPPGHRRTWIHRPRREETAAEGDTGSIPEEAFLHPDAPIRRIAGPPRGAPPASEEAPEEGAQEPAGPPDASAVADLLAALASEVRAGRPGRPLWAARSSSPLEAALRALLSGYMRRGGGGR